MLHCNSAASLSDEPPSFTSNKPIRFFRFTPKKGTFIRFGEEDIRNLLDSSMSQ
jgi:hypothetical protein